jgi:hypothetical protein
MRAHAIVMRGNLKSPMWSRPLLEPTCQAQGALQNREHSPVLLAIRGPLACDDSPQGQHLHRHAFQLTPSRVLYSVEKERKPSGRKIALT